ncbi:MAG TPA: sulfatase-like hydrolase/transferase [Anaerolineaceae bacterium]
MPLPNLLFIFTDEQRADTLAAYGNGQIEMPNLNRLAKSSTVFENAYCTSPVCTPSRSAILTGLFSHANGAIENNTPLRADIPCLPEYLPKGKYVAGYYGKWHLGDEIFAQHGFDEWVSIEDEYMRWYSPSRDRSARSSYHAFLAQSGILPDKPDGLYSRDLSARLPESLGKPAFLGTRASEFIRRNQSHPWILYVNFLEPHMPFFGPRDQQYDLESIPLPKNFYSYPDERNHPKARLIAQGYYERGHSGLPLKTEEDWRRLIANYWGLNSLVDTHAGKILQTVEECGLQDQTVIVFTSDHGDMMGSHHLLAKCVMYEEAVRIPLLIHLPGQSGSARFAGPVSQIDLLPTLLDLLGFGYPSSLHGQSLKPLLVGNTHEQDRDVFIEWNGTETGILEVYERAGLSPTLASMTTIEDFRSAIADPLRTIITPNQKKLVLSQAGHHELYDLVSDRFETNNLIHDPGWQANHKKMVEKIANWQEMTGDIIPLFQS